MNIIQQFEHEQMQTILKDKVVPDFAPGDTLRVMVKVVEGDRERVQAYEGVCIARKNSGINSSFTVRKMSFGEGVERVFPLYSQSIRIEVVRRGHVRRAKLYYLRDRSGKSARIAEKTNYANREVDNASASVETSATKVKKETKPKAEKQAKKAPATETESPQQA